MAELIGCRECNSPSCKGCNIKILADMLNRGKLNALMNKNRRIDSSVDAAPVVHGEWRDGADIIEARFHRHYFRCNVCHKFADSFVGGTENWWCSEKPNYCPNCGARMDGGAE